MLSSKSVLRCSLFLAALAGMVGSGSGAPLPAAATMGPLRVLSANPRYFTDGSGKAVYLTGSHYWQNLQDTSGRPTFNYTAYLDFMQQHNHNFMRMWMGEESSTPPVYMRTGPGTAADGGLKYDTNKLNQAYFDRLRSRVIAARDRGIYVSIMLFQGWSIELKGGNYNMWPAHWYNAANNINGINGDPDGDGNGREVHMLAVPAVTSRQETYVRRVIDTVSDLDNVLYEISNESHTQSVNWQYHMINLIHTYESGKPKQHPVGMTSLGFSDPKFGGTPTNPPLFNSPADWISPFGGGDADGYMKNPPASSGAKVILSDTDHIWGEGGDRTWVWKCFARGIQTLFMDGGIETFPASADWRDSARRAMGQARSYADRMNLAAMAPRGDLTSTGYALAAVGAEYLVYQSASGGFTVNLASGSYAAEWFNPVLGAASSGGTFTAAAGNRSFTPPFSGASVLYLKRTSSSGGLVPPTITSPANGATLGGTSVTVSWNAVSGATGYLVRCKDLTGTTPYDPRNTWNGTNFLYIDMYTPVSITFSVVSGHSYTFWIHSATSTTNFSASAEVQFSVGSNGGSVGSGIGLKGQYYDNMDFTALKVTRTDATVNFDWVKGSADPSMGVDTFSVRWTGQVQAQFSQTYTFYTTTDDGVRLWVNGQLLVDKWINQGATEWSGAITLTAGQKYSIKMEFYDNGGYAVAKLLWSSPSTPKQVVPKSQLYPQ